MRVPVTLFFFQSNNKERSRQQERIKAVEMGKGSSPAPLVNKDSLLAHCIAALLGFKSISKRLVKNIS